MSKPPRQPRRQLHGVILLDKPLNERLLNYVIRFSALIEDLKTFPKGIEHLIGENGTLLSGG